MYENIFNSPLLLKCIKLSVTHRLMLHATDQRPVGLNLSSDVDARFMTKQRLFYKYVLNYCSLNLKHYSKYQKPNPICLNKEPQSCHSKTGQINLATSANFKVNPMQICAFPMAHYAKQTHTSFLTQGRLEARRLLVSVQAV